LPVKLTIIKQYNLFYAAHLSLLYCDFHYNQIAQVSLKMDVMVI
jgi:hypothetical protein